MQHIVLHPRYKTQYFRMQEWPEDWIEEAVNLIRGEWRSRYKPAPPEDSDEEPVATTSSASTSGTSRGGRRSAQASAAVSTSL